MASERLTKQDAIAVQPLGNPAYTDPVILDHEFSKVWAPGWFCVGFSHDVPEKGDVFPVRVGIKPLIMIRDHTGQLRVFWNVCRHRGMVLVTAPSRIFGVLRCPYHSWCYALDGELKVTPHVGGPGLNIDASIDRQSLGLLEVRSAEWLGCVFVNLSGNAECFADFIAPLAHRWSDFSHRPLYAGHGECRFVIDVRANWKLAVENYCESYHLPWVHPGLNSYSRLEDHYSIAEASFAGQGTFAYRPLLSAAGERLPSFGGLEERWQDGAEYVVLYPNLLLGVHRDHIFAIRLDPIAPDLTREHVALWFASAEALDDAHVGIRQRLSVLWREVFEEDIYVVEGMQQGRHADGFDGGVFSPVMDLATAAFHRWAADRYAAAGLDAR